MIPSLKYILYALFILSVTHLKAQYETSNFGSINLITDGLNAPGRMAIDSNDNIYVTDAIQKTVVKYNAQGLIQKTLTTDINPLSIAINGKNQLFVSDQTTGDIYTIHADGTKTIFYTGLSFPASMVFGSNNILYVVDSQKKTVFGIDVSGSVVKEFTFSAFTYPTGIAFDKQNNRIIVSEHGGIGPDDYYCKSNNFQVSSWGTNASIYIFDVEGNKINQFGCFGTQDGRTQRIQGITVGTCGNIYAVDPYLGRINVYDENGNYITKFGLQGDLPGNLNLPMDIVFSSKNRAFVSSMNKGAIDVFSIELTLPTSTITSKDKIICQGETTDITVEFTGTAPWTFTYTQNGLNPIEKTATESPYHLPVTEEGIYIITSLTDNNGIVGKCFTGSTQIQVSNTPPTANIITGDFSKCSSSESGIHVQLTGIAPWTFTYTIDGLQPTEITTTKNQYIINADQSGVYEITKLSDAGCTGKAIISNSTITILPLPTATIAELESRIVIKPGTFTDLTIAFTGTAPWTFVYTRDEVNPISITTSDNPYILSVAEEGAYEILKVTDSYCYNTRNSGYPNIVFEDKPEPAVAILSSSTNYICIGGTTELTVNLSGTAPWSFSYTINGLNLTTINTSDSIFKIVTSTPGIYELQAITDVYNDTGGFSGKVTVIEYDPPTINLPSTLVICNGAFVDLNPGTFSNYLWSDGSTNPILTVNKTGIYSVTVTNENGCSKTASVIIEVDLTCKTLSINDYVSNDSKNYKEALLLYPNPSKGEFTLKMMTPTSVNSTINITIVNTSAQVIVNEIIKSNEINSSSPFVYKNYKLTHLKKGVYFINVRTDNYVQTTRLIIVN